MNEIESRANAHDGANWLATLKQLILDSRKEASEDMNQDRINTTRHPQDSDVKSQTKKSKKSKSKTKKRKAKSRSPSPSSQAKGSRNSSGCRQK